LKSSEATQAPRRTAGAGSVAEVFVTFLKLGLTSFGGPIAHLGYFHRELIARRRWLDEAHYAQLLALCQFLPGPASSQLGFALGLIRAGAPGALAAFLAFTLPSALLLFAFAYLLPRLDQGCGQAAIHGLKLVAVVVVAHGVLTMARRLTPDTPRRLIAGGSVVLILVSATASAQLLVIAMGALLGVLFCRHVTAATGETFDLGYSARTGVALLSIFVVLLIAAVVAHADAPRLQVAAAFYRAGSLVFGGGHVVLPLLQQALVTPGWIDTETFLAGYGAAQAVPGPMFSLAGFLGAQLEDGRGSVAGAGIALAAIFLPGFLLVAGVLPFWRTALNRPGTVSALAGVNAAVVGVLAAALYHPVWTTAVLTTGDLAIVVTGFALLMLPRTSVLLVLAWCVLISLGRTWLDTRCVV
jgi:chromate transporter